MPRLTLVAARLSLAAIVWMPSLGCGGEAEPTPAPGGGEPTQQAPAGDERLDRLRAAHRARPSDPEAALDLGLLLYENDPASREAQALFETVLEQRPDRRDVALKLVDSYLAAGDSEAAGALLGRLAPQLEANERFALDTTYALLGRGQAPQAKELWTRVAGGVQEDLRARPPEGFPPAADQALRQRVAETLFVQGLLVAQMGQKDEALRLLREADELGFPPLDSPLMERAADCLLGLQEFALATQAYREVAKRSPENARAQLRMAVALYSGGQIGEAEQELEGLLARSPDLPEANYYLGAVRFDEKRNAEAESHLRRELALDPRCFRCMAKLAHLAYLRGDDSECESWLAQATALDPEHAETNLVFGLLESRSRNYEKAIQHLSRVVERRPEDQRAHYQLALAYQRNGDAGRARQHREIYDRLLQEEKARTIGVEERTGILDRPAP